MIGAAGFIGAWIARRLRREGFTVIGVSRRARDDKDSTTRIMEYTIETVAELISELRPAVVIHAAGRASVRGSLTDPNSDFKDSVDLFQHVLEGIRRTNLRPRVAFLSSASVYGEVQTLPIPTTAATRPISPYGHHKVICETLAAEYATCFGIPSVIFRIFSVFGAEQKRLLVWDLFRKFEADADVVVDGTGEEARDYIHVEDLAEQIVRALKASRASRVVVNVGSGRSVTVRELALLVGKLLGSKKNVTFNGRRRVGDPVAWRADMSSYEELCDAQVSLDFQGRLEQVLRQWRG